MALPVSLAADPFSFDLPEQHIALRPIHPREAGKLLCVQAGGALADRRIADFPAFLRPGDALVLNESWVLPAALAGWRRARAGGQDIPIRCNLLARLGPDCWAVLAKPGKRLKVGDALQFGPHLPAEILHKDGAQVHLRFELAGEALDAAIEAIGQAPLPPYIAGRRPVDAQDLTDYQTIYANRGGQHPSVAAPTAGLHLTPPLLQALRAQDVDIVRISLGVGAGTFLPVSTDNLADHRMHAEPFCVSPGAADAINAARAGGGRIIALGTTTLRALESCPWQEGKIQPAQGETRIFLRPGSRLRSADMLLTNFHLPRSTLFMLVCAFAGTQAMQAAYAHAIAADYRFYSYGDASLLWRADG